MDNEESPVDLPNGLTKREWFAGLAMQGLIAHYGDDVLDKGYLERFSYDAADQMLKIGRYTESTKE